MIVPNLLQRSRNENQSSLRFHFFRRNVLYVLDLNGSEKKWGLYNCLKIWGGRRGLNPRHSVPQTDALPAELLPPHCNYRTYYAAAWVNGSITSILLPSNAGIEAKTRLRYAGHKCVYCRIIASEP